MVSNASEDFPEPESPVKTMSFSLGSSTVRFFRLCSRAPLMSIESVDKFSPGRLSYHSVIRIRSEHVFVSMLYYRGQLTQQSPSLGIPTEITNETLATGDG